MRFHTEIHRIVCTANAIESVNGRIRRAVKARGHFPNETAALKYVHMDIRRLPSLVAGRGTVRSQVRPGRVARV
ncbi:transposase [Streptomyces sp. NPDC056987]|uniref:transposase n=1 Tax=Streptomyces sp. NPDC056987 TaxID=3345988 RepID=UPI0036423318